LSHKFNPKNKNKLDNHRRREILPPEETLRKLLLKNGDTMADIGCGIGYFTIPASKIVGNECKVYALDTSSEMIEEIKLRIKDNNIYNIIPIKSEEEDLKLGDESVTYAFICNVLHEIDNVDKFLNDVKKVIKKGGKIVIVEWSKRVCELGPPVEHRLDNIFVISKLESMDFKNIELIDLGEHYGVIANKI
jgi:ubiquinone/menaquinone biosynthesis C-methylase UbiE